MDSQRRFRRSLAVLVLLAVLCGGCATRQVTLPALPQGVPQTIEVIAKSNLPADQKTKLIEEVIQSTERTYNRMVERLDAQGKNLKDTVLQFFTLAGAIAALILGANN